MFTTDPYLNRAQKLYDVILADLDYDDASCVLDIARTLMYAAQKKKWVEEAKNDTAQRDVSRTAE